MFSPNSQYILSNALHFLYRVRNGTRFQPTEVTLGKDAVEFVEVKSGLFDGDRIVTQRVAHSLYVSLLATYHKTVFFNRLGEVHDRSILTFGLIRDNGNKPIDRHRA